MRRSAASRPDEARFIPVDRHERKLALASERHRPETGRGRIEEAPEGGQTLFQRPARGDQRQHDGQSRKPFIQARAEPIQSLGN